MLQNLVGRDIIYLRWQRKISFLSIDYFLEMAFSEDQDIQGENAITQLFQDEILRPHEQIQLVSRKPFTWIEYVRKFSIS